MYIQHQSTQVESSTQCAYILQKGTEIVNCYYCFIFTIIQLKTPLHVAIENRRTEIAYI